MRKALALLPVALAVAGIAPAAAQQPQPTPTPPSTADTGFFRPYPYPALQSPKPGEPDPRSFLSAPGQTQPFAHWASPQSGVQAPPTAVRPPLVPAPVVAEPYSAVTSPNAPGNVVVTPAGTPATGQEPVERQMDRVEVQNQLARENAPAPIGGAFTGSTSERDR